MKARGPRRLLDAETARKIFEDPHSGEDALRKIGVLQLKSLCKEYTIEVRSASDGNLRKEDYIQARLCAPIGPLAGIWGGSVSVEEGIERTVNSMITDGQTKKRKANDL